MILQIESFLREKENIFNKLYDLQIEFEEREQDVTELQREEVEKLRELFRTRTKMTWNVVMTQEITLVSQTEQVITFCLFFLFSYWSFLQVLIFVVDLIRKERRPGCFPLFWNFAVKFGDKELLFLNAKCSLSSWSKLAIGHKKWLLNNILFIIKPFLITKLDCTMIQNSYQVYHWEVCDYIFSAKCTLKKHVESVHEVKKPFKCEICDYICNFYFRSCDYLKLPCMVWLTPF